MFAEIVILPFCKSWVKQAGLCLQGTGSFEEMCMKERAELATEGIVVVAVDIIRSPLPGDEVCSMHVQSWAFQTLLLMPRVRPPPPPSTDIQPQAQRWRSTASHGTLPVGN